MQGRKDYQPKMLYQIHLDDLVPQDNFYRQLSKEVDFHFLYKSTSAYYGNEGQESIDPVVFFKLCLVGYLNNINSDRKLIAYSSNCLDVRLFLGYDIDESLPWHSTISRTRQLYGEEVFLDLFKQILCLCVDKGMVRGKRQAVDSAFVKANASMDSLVEKEVIAKDAEVYAEELNAGSQYKVSKERKEWVEQHHRWKTEAYKDMPGHNKTTIRKDEFGNEIRPRFLSNHTHYSGTDKDARISVKPGKSRQMNYFAQVAVDDKHHVITGAMADFADKRDSQCLPNILNQTIENLKENDIDIEQICADAGYSSGSSLSYLEEKKIDAYIPNFGQYKNSREGFVYNKELDRYECTRGNKAVLPFRKQIIDSKGYEKKVYRSTNEKCKNCALRSTCIGTSDFKKLDDSVAKPYYDRMHEKLQTPYAKRMSKIRSKTVEPVLGTLINYMNMKRVNSRGIRQATKHVILSALCYNLKKYLKFIAKNRKTTAQRMELSEQLQSFIKMISIEAYRYKISH